MRKQEFWEKLREIDQKTTRTTSIKLGMVTEAIVKKNCKILDMNKSRFIRIAISFLDDFMTSLPDPELITEVLRMKKFD